jgi:hypothetical protein
MIYLIPASLYLSDRMLDAHIGILIRPASLLIDNDIGSSGDAHGEDVMVSRPHVHGVE